MDFYNVAGGSWYKGAGPTPELDAVHLNHIYGTPQFEMNFANGIETVRDTLWRQVDGALQHATVTYTSTMRRDGWCDAHCGLSSGVICLRMAELAEIASWQNV